MNLQKKTMACGMALLIAAGLSASGWFGSTPPARGNGAAEADANCGRNDSRDPAPRRPRTAKTAVANTQGSHSRAGFTQIAARAESAKRRQAEEKIGNGPAMRPIIHEVRRRTRSADFSHARQPAGALESEAMPNAVAQADDSGNCQSPAAAPQTHEGVATFTGSPQPSVAAALYANSSDADWSQMGSHEQTAVVELGSYAEEAVQALDAAAADIPDMAWERKRIASETDAYLRMSLGYERFNRLCFLAAANRQAQADGLPAVE